jgi:hypothetical protein
MEENTLAQTESVLTGFGGALALNIVCNSFLHSFHIKRLN